ncbi:hypothetical protein [Chryseobacterium aquaticum]|uniref:Uncharacterized protein n=1 Tax=Chryseobacterium aquaticum subsp. greenlandense TaxID=345663 RepID=A0A101CHM9_9FLAO|nr:hypothetical protein [Chryseobacterium aquaticum]KUJ56436.1 hypothetical protein AR686_07695 [Chryseobacterium aquaticum subsp. greenlandense]
MKIKELRIGNLVYGVFEDDEENSNHSVCLVTGLSEDQYLGEGWNFMLENMERKDVENYFEMKPIPLTQEWLLKFGFEKDNEVDEIDGMLFVIFYIGDYIVEHWISEDIFNFTDDCNLKVQVSSVHQLQNLFFCLCGKELTIK